MPVQITILGLGPLGTSLGLALSNAKDQVTCVGSDADGEAMRQAQKLGAVQRTTINLPDAVRQADAVLLCVPLDELRKTMEAIRQDLKPGVVVLDTSAAPLLSTAWAREFFPAQNCYFLTFTPALNPAYLAETPAAAHKDAFQNGCIFISHPLGIDASAIEFSENLVRLLGGRAVFSEVHEVEGLLALTRWLPLLASAAVQGAAYDQPGWKEARRLAGTDMALAGLPLAVFQNDAEAGLALSGAKDNALRMIDLLTAELRELRGYLAAGQQAELDGRLAETRQARLAWLAQREQGNWDEVEKRPAIPSVGETLGRLVGIRPRTKR